MAQQSRQGERLLASIRAAVNFGKSYPPTPTTAELEARAELARDRELGPDRPRVTHSLRCWGCPFK